MGLLNRWKALHSLTCKLFIVRKENHYAQHGTNLSLKKVILFQTNSFLNIDFDFTHMIEGHSFRISRIEDSINKYELRIDNRSFDEVRLGKGKSNKSSSTLDYAKKSNDPFADF